MAEQSTNAEEWENEYQIASKGSTIQRKYRKRRETTEGRKLSLDDVEAIIARLQRGEPPALIARDYPVSRVMISLIASGKKWATITRKLQVALPHAGTMMFSWTYDPRAISQEERQAAQQLIDMLRQYARERSASLETRE